jgi:hypothetical protein
MNKPSPAADSVALAATSKSDETEVASITVTTEVTTPITTEIAAPETVGEPLPAKEKVAKKAAPKNAAKKTEVASTKIAPPEPENGTAKKNAVLKKSKPVKKVTAVKIEKSEPVEKMTADKYTPAVEKNLAKLLKLLNVIKVHGIDSAIQIMRDTQPVFESVQVAKKHNVKMSKVRRGRQPGWTKYTPKQEAYFAKLLKKHGVTSTQKILAADYDEELGQLRNQKILPQPLRVSTSVLNRIIVRDKLTVPKLRNRKKANKVKVAKENKVKVAKETEVKVAKETKVIGRPKKYTGALAKHMVGLVREHNISMAAQILNAPKGKLVKLRNKTLVPKPLHVSHATLSKLAKAEGVQIIRGHQSATPKAKVGRPKGSTNKAKVGRPKGSTNKAKVGRPKGSTSAPSRGRQKGWVKYKGALAKYMLSLVRKYNLSMATQILNAPKGKLAKLRNATLVPEPLRVSVITLSKMAHTAGIPITRRQQSAA